MEKLWYKNWPKGVPKSIKYPEIRVDELVKNVADKYPERIALVFQGKEIKYSELDEMINRFATGLHGLGVKKGDVVALLMPNCPQFPIAYYGSERIGAIVTPCSPLHSERELEYQLNDSGAETAITVDLKITYGKLKRIKDKTKLKRVEISSLSEFLPPELAEVYPIVMKDMMEEIEKTEDTFFFKELLESPPNPPEVDVNVREDVAVLAYTGGTTGLPKGAMLTHYNRVANCIQVGAWIAPAFGYEVPADFQPERIDEILPQEIFRGITVVPWFHAMGMLGYLDVPLSNGTTLIVLPRFDPVEYLETMKQYDVQFAGGAPPIFLPLLDHPEFEKYKERFSKLRLCVSGAAPLPVEHLKRLKKEVGGVVLEAYGLTEGTMGELFNPTHPDAMRKEGSVGMPISDVDAKVVDAERGERELPPREVGELIFRGPMVMKGYWNKPE